MNKAAAHSKRGIHADLTASLMSFPEAVMNAIPTHINTREELRDELDRAETAHYQLVGRAVVLSRLFELLAANRDEQGHAKNVDFGCQREGEFWQGLRELTEEIIDRSDVMKAGNDAASRFQRQASNGGAR